MKKVMIFGTFDILHPGHTHFIKEAKEYGDYLVIVVARDKTVAELKKHPTINKENTRKTNLEQLGLADKVILGEEGDKYAVIRREKPDIIALGYDQKFYIDELEDQIDDHVQIVRLSPFRPDIYKSSKLVSLSKE